MTDEKADLPTLSILHSKRLPNPVKFPFTAYSHIHDLLAIVTSVWDVSVFRIASGQSAFTVKRKDSTSEVTALSWKEDGTCFGIGWSDGTYGIYDGGTGKLLYMTPLSLDDARKDIADWKLDLLPYIPDGEDEDGPGRTTAAILGWMGHDVGKRKPTQKRVKITTEDWYDSLDDDSAIDRGNGDMSGATLTDLPRAITSLDITRVLPRLSAVPTHGLKGPRGGASNTKFSTQLLTDNVFAPEHASDANLIQSLLVCQDTGSVQVLLNETVHIGSCQISGKPLLHAANVQSGDHAILAEAVDGIRSLHILDLPLETLSSPLIHVIAINTKRIQTLLEYIVLTTRCIENDYTTNVFLPERFLNILQEDLDNRKDGSTCVSALFHLAMTGTFHEDLVPWLCEIVKDTNHKRWDQALNSMYDCLQNHLFINLLPALDRFSIAVTRLRGLATVHEGSTKFDCPPHLFSNILDKIDSIRLTAQKMQLVLQSEYRRCRAFLKWLKMQIEISIAEPFSNSALETEEREIPSMDFASILSYIKESMIVSKLDLHIKYRPGMEGETTKEKFFEHDIIRNMSYERAKKAIKEFDPLKPGGGLDRKEVNDPIALLNLPALTCALTGHVRVALEQITQWQSRMLSRPITIPLPLDAEAEVADMVMMSSSSPANKPTTALLVLHPSHPQDITILTSTSSLTSTTHSLLPTLQILSAKWIPHSFSTDTGTGITLPTILTLNRHENGDTSLMRHTPPPVATNANTNANDDDAPTPTLTSEILHVFPAGIAFKPCAIVVGGRAGKVVCVVLGQHGRDWRVLDVDGANRGLSMAEVAEVLERAGEGEGEDEMDEM